MYNPRSSELTFVFLAVSLWFLESSLGIAKKKNYDLVMRVRVTTYIYYMCFILVLRIFISILDKIFWN